MLVARLDDGHANIGKVPVAGAAPRCQLPFTLRFIENEFVVDSIPGAIGEELRVGDVVVELDGRAIRDLVNELRPFQGASNEAGRMRRLEAPLARGPCGKAKLKLTIERDGTRRIVIERAPGAWESSMRPTPHDRPGETLQWLTPKVAYLKLSSIKQADIERQVSEIAAKADALIVDIRNYPSEFVVFALGSRLVDTSTPFATFLLPRWGTPGAFDFGSPVRLGGDTPQFRGRVAILVDESSISQAEYTAMALRASPRAIVVGSQTAGADGDVSPIVLPGHVPLGLSGIGVFYPDRTPTQQTGVKIDVPCHPTIAGIRAGRDEILECALSALKGSDLSVR
jgi:C-terminal processing protease CtpA/Prc